MLEFVKLDDIILKSLSDVDGSGCLLWLADLSQRVCRRRREKCPRPPDRLSSGSTVKMSSAGKNRNTGTLPRSKRVRGPSLDRSYAPFAGRGNAAWELVGIGWNGDV